MHMVQTRIFTRLRFSCFARESYIKNKLNKFILFIKNGCFCFTADVDECSTGQANCGQTCINTDGGYKCDCQTGYSLNNDGTCSGDMLSYDDELCLLRSGLIMLIIDLIIIVIIIIIGFAFVRTQSCFTSPLR